LTGVLAGDFSVIALADSFADVLSQLSRLFQRLFSCLNRTQLLNYTIVIVNKETHEILTGHLTSHSSMVKKWNYYSPNPNPCKQCRQAPPYQIHCLFSRTRSAE